LALLRGFEGFALPTSILIDAASNEIGRMVGDATWDHQDAQALIRFYLK
jgi:hypothetical protein